MSLSRRCFLSLTLAAGACSRPGSGYRGWAFVAVQGRRAVAAVDLLGFHVRARIPLEAEPVSVFAHPDASAARLLAVTPRARSIEEIDVRTLKRVGSLRLPAPPVAAKPDPRGQALWSLTADPPALHRTLFSSGKVERSFPLPERPVHWDLGPDGALACVATASGATFLLDLANGSRRPGPHLGALPGPLLFRSDGQLVLAANRQQRMLTVFEPESGETVVDLPLALRPDRFCMIQDGGQLFITGDGRDAVVIAYPYRTEIAQTALSGRKPAEMASSQTPAFLFVSNPEAGSVTVFDISTQRVVAVTGVGVRPGPIAVTPDQQYALVLHSGSGDLGVIRIAAIAARRTKSAPLFTMIPVGERPAGLCVMPTPED